MLYFIYNFQAFLLVMIRVHSMFMVAPFFSSGVTPIRLKSLLAFFVALVIFPLIMKNGISVSGNMLEYGLMVLWQVVIGIYIGFIASIIFTAFQLAGQYFSVQIGFGFSEVVDPMAQISVPIIGQMKNMMGLLVFLYINGHHFLLSAIYRSFELAPIMSFSPTAIESHMKYLIYSFSGMFVVALKIALPIMATVFLVSVAMGVLAKTAPQMNIMMLGFPFKILVAFVLIVFLAPLIIRIMQVSMERSFHFISKILMYWPV
ncbi:MAG: flagellar biosynthetic protein FliR [Spirochaetes bacterium]|jgi:flagellar biosynthetic protein FliR|nr:flagellar biosynthetic protein FliR [Spirochaetota bacterium]